MATEGYYKGHDGKFYLREWWETNSNRLGAEGYRDHEVTEKEFRVGKAKRWLAESEHQLKLAKKHYLKVMDQYNPDKTPRVDYVPQPVYRNEDKPTLTLTSGDKKMKATVNSIETVDGKTMSSNWSLPMTIIHTDVGNFVDYGKHSENWQSLVGESVMITTEPCKRVPTLTWIKLA